MKRNRGWGFKEASLIYSIKELDMFVLPYTWVSPAWAENPIFIRSEQFNTFFQTSKKEYNFENFFKGAFCYHWHNRWNMTIQENSIILQLVKIIKNNLSTLKIS